MYVVCVLLYDLHMYVVCVLLYDLHMYVVCVLLYDLHMYVVCVLEIPPSCAAGNLHTQHDGILNTHVKGYLVFVNTDHCTKT